MFPSISKATPQTVYTTSFTASSNLVITPVSSFTIRVNGQVAVTNNIIVNAGDVVTAVVTSPDDWLWHQFYFYKIDNVTSSFAVVNKSLYTIRVKPADALKRWYMYTPPAHTATFKFPVGTEYDVNFGTTYDVIPADVHVVLNSLDNSVYFYNTNAVQVSKITLPADPIDYVKIPQKQTIVVLTRSGESYEIFLNSTAQGLAPFFARRNYSEFTESTFIFQLPGEDLITYLRRIRAKTSIPPATCIAFTGTYIIAGGNGSVWVVDPMTGFTLLNNFPIEEMVMNIAPLPNNAGMILITQSQKVIKMDMSGNITELHQGTALWQPALFNNRVYIPEGNVGYLKVYNIITDSFDPDIPLDDFSPSYITVDSGNMYVSGHDSERVLVFDSDMNVTEKTFKDKVTLVSAVKGSILASHYLKTYKILDLQDLKRIVQVEFRRRRGPVSHIGTNTVTVKTLGSDEVVAYTPPSAWLWVNGQRTYSEQLRGTTLVDDNIISLNLSAKTAGLQRTNCVIGDIAYDYDIEAVAQTYYPRHIDFPIQTPGEFGIHRRTITLPKFFTPCLMSIEYGVISINGAYYYGDSLVNADDVITIEIDTYGNSVLPVFTIGLRQFVIPVSVSSNIVTVDYIDDNLNPGTQLIKEIEFQELESKFDYIIPGYYDLTISKNDVNITGNYYQQFGKGDKLKVTYVSSFKLYDRRDVYILGPTNYKFTAQNTFEALINYLDYGNLQLPYVRVFDPYDPGLPDYFIGSNYGKARLIEVPTVQYYTANITISGMPFAYSNANLSITGGDSYFVVDGELTFNSNVRLYNGNNLALARNVVSYFDEPVVLTQYLPTGDDDGFTGVEVGRWNIVNHTIVDTDEDSKETSLRILGSQLEVEFHRQIESEKGQFDRNRPTQRNINFINNELESPYQFVDTSAVAELNQLIRSPVAEALKEEKDLGGTIQFSLTQMPIEIIQNFSAVGVENKIVKLSTQQRNLNAYRESLNENTTFKDLASGVSLSMPTDLKGLAGRVIFADSKLTVIDGAINQTIKDSSSVIDGYNIEGFNESSINAEQIKVSRFRQNLRTVLAHLTQFDIPTELIVYGALLTRDVNGAYIQDASRIEFNNSKVMDLSGLVTDPEINNSQVIIDDKIYSVQRDRTSYRAQNTQYEWAETANDHTVDASRLRVDADANSVVDGAKFVQQRETYFVESFIRVKKYTIDEIIDQDISWQFDLFSAFPTSPNKFKDQKDNMAVEAIGRPEILIENIFKNKKVNAYIESSNYLNSQVGFDLSMPLSKDVQSTDFDLIDLNFHRNKTPSRRLDGSTLLRLKMQPRLRQQSYIESTGILFDIKTDAYASLEFPFKIQNRNYIDSSMDFKQVSLFDPILTRQDFNKLTEAASIYVDEVPERLIFASPNSLKGIYETRHPEFILNNDLVEKIIGPETIAFEFYDAEKRIINSAPVFGVPEALVKNHYFTRQDFDIRNKHFGFALQLFETRILNPMLAYQPLESLVRNSVLGDLSFDPTNLAVWLEKKNFSKENTVRGSFVPMDFGSYPALEKWSVKMQFTLDPTGEWSELMRYGRADALSNTYLKPDWGLYEYATDPIGILKFDLTVDQPDYNAEVKMKLVKAEPNLYFTAITLPKFEQGFVWEHDISVDYGAFATEQDAIAAAVNYTDFRPMLIMDTNLWTYRVLFDTGLVCPLPTGRYPIAWLIRGG